MPTSPEGIQKVVIEAEKLNPSSLVDLFILDCSSLGGDVFYFTPATDTNRTPLVFQGITYVPFPVSAKGFDLRGVTSSGQVPRPTVAFSNVTGIFSGLSIAFDDLAGAVITRRRTFARFLDNQPDADPNAAFPDEVYTIDRKSTENKLTIEFELSTGFDVEGVMLPGRLVNCAICNVAYRGPYCTFAKDVALTDETGAAISLALRFLGPWSNTLNYIFGDGVTDGDSRVWACNNELGILGGSRPSLDTSGAWVLAQNFRGPFDPTATYNNGDVVYTVSSQGLRRYFFFHGSSILGGLAIPPNSNFWYEDICPKTLQKGCKARFDPLNSGQPLPWGAFPGTQSISSML